MPRRKLWIVALAASLCSPAFAADEPKAADPKPAEPKAAPKLDGVWEGWVVEGKGDNPNRGQIHLQLNIDGDKLTSKDLGGGSGGGFGGGRGRGGGGGGGAGGDLGSGTIKIVESGGVMQLDATRTPGAGGGGGGGGRGRGPGGGGGGVNQGIMAVEGDTLKWCVANRGGRPADFETNRGKGQFLLILTKQKPAEKTPTDKAPTEKKPTEDAPKK